jgi:hypothetical protein
MKSLLGIETPLFATKQQMGGRCCINAGGAKKILVIVDALSNKVII